MGCHRLATEQYVWNTDDGTNAISVPLCGDCSEDQQPPETVDVLEVQGALGFHICQCSGEAPGGWPACDICDTGEDEG